MSKFYKFLERQFSIFKDKLNLKDLVVLVKWIKDFI